MLWVGTCDGLNVFDGYSAYPTRMMPDFSMLAGNIIEDIIESSPGILWVQTNYALNRIIPTSRTCEVFPDYHGQEKIRVSPGGDVFVLSENGCLSYFDDVNSSFKELTKLNIPFDEILEMRVDNNGIRFFTKTGIMDLSFSKNRNKLTPSSSRWVSRAKLKYAFDNIDIVLAVDEQYNLVEFRQNDIHPILIFNIKDEIHKRGIVSDILQDNNGNIFISFLTDGLVKLAKDYGKDYSVVDLDVNVGVFCLARSNKQNIIWAGTDCHGVYVFYDGVYSIQSTTFTDLGKRISKPVRALLCDKEGTLWIGTKGDGLLQIEDFRSSRETGNYNLRLFNSTNSNLSHNSVYALSPSWRNLFWIATDKGLAYYSYNDRRIHNIESNVVPLELVHSIHETNDSTLLLTSLGKGVFKVTVKGPKDAPIFTDIKQYKVSDGNVSSNYFFSQSIDSYGTPIFCNRGLGIMALEGDSLKSILDLKNEYQNKAVNDIFAVIRDKNTLWCGTGTGLLKVTPDGHRLFVGIEKGFPNSTIHSMLRDDDGMLWFSTNNGLVKFNPDVKEAQVYSDYYGIPINEYSDGAAFKDVNTLFFGGVDGIVEVSKNPYYRPVDKYLPPIALLSLSISGKNEALFDYYNRESENKNILNLRSDQNYFSLTFSVPDFINPENYTFLYSLDGDNWINNGTSRIITFTGMPYGKKTLRVKYINREAGLEGPEYRLTIDIAAPWYLTMFAKIFYTFALLALIIVSVKVYLSRQKEKQDLLFEKIEQQHKEDMYEGKLRFFTNITHEFCTPLTLIFGGCERILANHDADANMQKYVSLIRSNTERLNSLIQDLIDFRRIETGHKEKKIVNLNVSEMGNDIFRSFSIIAEQNKISFSNEVEKNINFNSDYKALLRIMSNLLSNAFKYTPANGNVSLRIKTEMGNLVIEVYNTGKGLSEADKKHIFNRYNILDNVEENATRGLSSRNGLGMAICKSLVDLLDGKIEIESEPNSYALFRVILPPIECSGIDSIESDDEIIPVLPDDISTMHGSSGEREYSKDKQNILVIDDNQDIQTLLTDSLLEYNVIVASNANEGLDALKNNCIDLIITDIMMPAGIDGVTLTKRIKENRHTGHIPLIILSAKNTSKDKIAGLASGADAYVGKPFHLNYLRALIVRLLENRKKLSEYFNTSASAFVYSGGQLVDKESAVFVKKVVEFIDSNIDDPELTPEQLAGHMQISVRNLYRKFKDYDLASPGDFIKSHRITFAAKLLVTTSLTVQEIIYRCGFNNRSHFYREFDKQFNMSPGNYRSTHKTKGDIEAQESETT